MSTFTADRCEDSITQRNAVRLFPAHYALAAQSSLSTLAPTGFRHTYSLPEASPYLTDEDDESMFDLNAVGSRLEESISLVASDFVGEEPTVRLVSTPKFNVDVAGRSAATSRRFTRWRLRPPQGRYDWRDRFRQLTEWRGSPEKGEAERLSGDALALASEIALHAERRAASRDVYLPTVLAPLSDGSVHIEWNVRGSVNWHVEVAVTGSRDRFHMLRTVEQPTGAILEMSEFVDLPYVLIRAEFELLLRRAPTAD
jgi:hypothetical protein